MEGRRRVIRVTLPRNWRRLAELLSRRESREEVASRTPDSYGALIRLYAHALEKASQCMEFDCARGRGRAEKLRELLAAERAQLVDNVTREWAEEMLRLYEERSRDPSVRPRQANVGASIGHNVNEILEMLRLRRSVRWFARREVRENHLRVAVEFARCAPTSCHRQAVRIYATNKPEIARAAHSCCLGHSGFGSFIPAFAAICTDTNPYAMPDEFPLVYVDGAICAAFFVLGCHAQGISATLMAWSSLREAAEAQLRQLLGIPKHYEIVVTCAIGFPEMVTPSPPRKPLNDWLVMEQGPQ